LRDQTEFRYGGEADRERPLHPEQCSDQQWAEYLFYRDNPKGLLRERWVHSFGCRKWFNVIRDTATHDIVEIAPIGNSAQATGGDE